MRILLITILCMVVQFGLSVYLVPSDYSQKRIDYEYQSIKVEFGQEFARKVAERANQWLKAVPLFNDTHLNESHEFYDQAEGRPNNLEKLRRKAYQPPANLELSLYQIFLRFSLLSYWAPLLLVLYSVFLLEGLSQRKINKQNFSYSAVERNRLLIRFMGLLLIITSLCIFSITAVPVLVLLLCILMLCPVLMFVIASSKRSL